jgi:hypothetical protein
MVKFLTFGVEVSDIPCWQMGGDGGDGGGCVF